MAEAFPKMWNPLSLLVFTLQGLSAAQPWAAQAMPPRPRRSYPYSLLALEISYVGFIQILHDPL